MYLAWLVMTEGESFRVRRAPLGSRVLAKGERKRLLLAFLGDSGGLGKRLQF